MVLNRIKRAKLGQSFVNKIKIRPIRPKEITDGTSPYEDPLYEKKTRRKKNKEKDKDTKKKTSAA